MAKPIVAPFRRKKEGKTDYKRRLSLLKSGLPRLVIRRSNKSIQVQLVTYEPDGDKVLATARATDLKKHNWKGSTGNIPAAYLTGLLIAEKMKTSLNSDVILDIGLQKHQKGGRIYAAAKGAIDGGLHVRVSEDALPPEERINGAHISDATAKAVAETKIKIMTK